MFSRSLCLTGTKSTNGSSKQQIRQVNYLEAVHSYCSEILNVDHFKSTTDQTIAVRIYLVLFFLNMTFPLSYMRYLVLGRNGLTALECATSMHTHALNLQPKLSLSLSPMHFGVKKFSSSLCLTGTKSNKIGQVNYLEDVHCSCSVIQNVHHLKSATNQIIAVCILLSPFLNMTI